MGENDFRSISCEIMEGLDQILEAYCWSVRPFVRSSTIYSGCPVSAAPPTLFGQSF